MSRGEEVEPEVTPNLSLAVRQALLDQLVLDIERELQTTHMALLARAAMNWDAARREAATLRSARAKTYCEFAEPGGDFEDDEGPAPTQAQPCWKKTAEDPEGDLPERPIANWCVSCARRQQLHEQYIEAVKRRGIAQRTLTKLAGKVAAQKSDASA